MRTLTTRRLRLRPLNLNDAGFIYELVNDPDWIRWIGDKKVRNLDDAQSYIENGPIKMRREHGFGLNLIELQTDRTAIGVCGLIKRDSLEAPDLGFALLPEFRGDGVATEAAAAVLLDAHARLGIDRVLGISNPENQASIAVLIKLGFTHENQTSSTPSGEVLTILSINTANLPKTQNPI